MRITTKTGWMAEGRNECVDKLRQILEKGNGKDDNHSLEQIPLFLSFSLWKEEEGKNGLTRKREDHVLLSMTIKHLSSLSSLA